MAKRKNLLMVAEPKIMVLRPLVGFFFLNDGCSKLPSLLIISNTLLFFLYKSNYPPWGVISNTFGVLKKQSKASKCIRDQKKREKIHNSTGYGTKTEHSRQDDRNF
jgi:hypothetical protein